MMDIRGVTHSVGAKVEEDRPIAIACWLCGEHSEIRHKLYMDPL